MVRNNVFTPCRKSAQIAQAKSCVCLKMMILLEFFNNLSRPKQPNYIKEKKGTKKIDTTGSNGIFLNFCDYAALQKVENITQSTSF